MIKNLNKKSEHELTAQTIVASEVLDAKTIYSTMCASCHSLDNKIKMVGPSFSGLFGKEQIVIRDGAEVSVKVDRAYINNSIKKPFAEYPKGMLPGMPDLGLSENQRAAMVDFIQRVDGE